MENKKLFQIGDVAKMFHISVGSLQHYEQAGLLKQAIAIIVHVSLRF